MVPLWYSCEERGTNTAICVASHTVMALGFVAWCGNDPAHTPRWQHNRNLCACADMVSDMSLSIVHKYPAPSVDGIQARTGQGYWQERLYALGYIGPSYPVPAIRYEYVMLEGDVYIYAMGRGGDYELIAWNDPS
jgi:hypothetical protein